MHQKNRYYVNLNQTKVEPRCSATTRPPKSGLMMPYTERCIYIGVSHAIAVY